MEFLLGENDSVSKRIDADLKPVGRFFDCKALIIFHLEGSALLYGQCLPGPF